MNAIDALLQGKKGVVATKKTGKVSAIDQLLQKKPVKPTIQPVKTTLPTQQNYIKATLPSYSTSFNQEEPEEQKGISQSVKDNLIYTAKDPVNPVNTARAVLKMVKSPVSLVKEYAKAIMPKTTAELETQIEAQKKSNQPMRFEVGAGMSNVEKVLPGPRISTLEAIQQGAQIEPVQAGEAPQVSPVRQAQQVVRKPDLSPEKPSAIDKLLSGVSAVGGAIRASSVAASLPISLTANAFSKEKLPARDIIEATSKMIEDEMREGGTASTAKGAQLYLASRGIGKYGGEDVNVGDIAVLSLIGLGDIMGDPVFYFGAIKPALNQLKFNLEYKKVGQVGLKAKPGVKITNPQKSIIDVGDDLKMVIDPKAKKVTLKGYAKRGVTGKPINEKAIVNVANNISEQVGVPISSKVVGNDIVLSAGKGAMANVSKTTKPIVSPEIPAKPSVEIPVKSPEPQIKPQKAQGEVLPTKTTKVSPEAKPSVVEPLIEEAKKYKTAEEFIKAQGTPVYHGTNYANARMIQKEGINPENAGAIQDWMKGNKYSFFTGDEKYAQSYGIQKGGGDTKSGRSFVLAIKSPKDIQIETSTFKKGMKFPDLVSQQKINPENIYIKGIDNKWYPIKEFNFFTGESDTFIGKTKLDELPIKTKSQLTDIWNKANKQTLPKPKKQPIKYVPVEKPVDLRKKITTERIVAKPSIPQRIKAESIKSGLEDAFGDIEYYNKVSVKRQAEETAKLINEDYDRAIRIAMGQENAPGDLLPESVLIGVKNQAIKTGDTELLINLATAEGGVARESTVLGQRIKMLDEGLEDDAFRNIKKVVSERRNNYQKKTGKSVDKAIKQETDKIKEAIKKSAPKKDDWLDFVNSITC